MIKKCFNIFPSDDVRSAVDALTEEFPQEALCVLDYFEDIYIGRIARWRHRTPQFPVSMWNVYDRVQDDLPRTNNAVEGWHRAFQALVGSHHANFWKFIGCLQKEEVLTHAKLVQMENGHPNPQPRRKYKDLNNRISVIVENYDPQNVIHYLRSISYNIRV